jgi:hypothetical protein
MEVFMLRKLIVASTLGIFLATSVITPASAATIKTGTSCKKAGQSVKVGKKTYICGKNPFLSPTKNTWALKQCIEGYEDYIYIKEDLIPQAEEMLGLLSGADKITQQAQIDKFTSDNVPVLAALKSRWCKRGA